jgi:hypothetical protein
MPDYKLELEKAQKNTANLVGISCEIYIRDKGICWICNEFVYPRDYDLGHLIDRCNGGPDTYDNMAVMHRHCNQTKPRHETLEEAMRWKLTPAHLYHAPIKTIKPKAFSDRYSTLMGSLTTDRRDEVRQLVIKHFADHPELSQDKDRHSNHKIRDIRQLARTLNITVSDIRLILYPRNS